MCVGVGEGVGTVLAKQDCSSRDVEERTVESRGLARQAETLPPHSPTARVRKREASPVSSRGHFHRHSRGRNQLHEVTNLYASFTRPLHNRSLARTMCESCPEAPPPQEQQYASHTRVTADQASLLWWIILV